MSPLSKRLRKALPLLAALALPSKADIVQVNGKKYDVKDTDKGPVVTDVLNEF